MFKIKYDTTLYNFAEIVESYFFNDNKISLNEIHNFKDEIGNLLGNLDVFTREKDQSTQFHKKFYELARLNLFESLYTDFIKNIVRPLYLCIVYLYETHLQRYKVGRVDA